MIFVRRGGKTRRVCAVLFAVVFLTLAVFMASLFPDKFFAESSPQSRADSMVRTLDIIDGTNCAEDVRYTAARAWFGSGHFAYISSVPRVGAHAGAEPAHDFPSSSSCVGGTYTVARE